MKNIINLLLSLRDMDVRLFGIRRDLEYLPAELDRLEAEYSTLSKELEQHERKLAKLEKKIEDLKLDVELGEKTIAQLIGKVNSAKQQIEYQAKKNELESERRDHRKMEDALLKLMEEQEAFLPEIAARRATAEEKRAALEAFRADVAARRKTYDAEMAEIGEKRNALLADLPIEERETYDRVAQQRGDAMSELVLIGEMQYMCSACRGRIQTNRVARILKMKQLEQCTSCGRILYSSEKLK